MIVALVVIFEVLGILSAVHAVMSVRTPQGSIAWAVSLVTFPFVAVPGYWVFGRDKFKGYVLTRQNELDNLSSIILQANQNLAAVTVDAGHSSGAVRLAETLARSPLTNGNHAELLIDGEATFDSIFAGIDAATDYVLVQFYIVKDDELGRQLQKKLIAAADRGVTILFLYDEIGSLGLSSTYRQKLVDAGIDVRPFHSRKGLGNRFQLNFRNHRKTVVVDGKVAWIGGHNVGDEYLGSDPSFGDWRDTHVRLEGPAAIGAQLAFVEINSATERVWIASPYFVPDDAIVQALQLAGLRGVDVRILIPEKTDNLLVTMAAYSFLDEVKEAGVKFYRYQGGFLHQKVVLVDNSLATVGTANFDNRSFRLNFEITAAVADRDFAHAVESMLEDDFSKSRLMERDEYDQKSFWFKLAVRSSRLTAPIL